MNEKKWEEEFEEVASTLRNKMLKKTDTFFWARSFWFAAWDTQQIKISTLEKKVKKLEETKKELNEEIIHFCNTMERMIDKIIKEK